MASLLQTIGSELSDNWPAFTYILVMTAFSIRFLQERREEARIVKRIGDEVQAEFRLRFDRIEELLQEARLVSRIEIQGKDFVHR
jgi:hypothetical protein